MDPTCKHQGLIQNAVKNMLDRGVINQKTATDLVESDVRSPHFYTLPKIHKRLENPPGRPIVSSCQAPTERISAFVDQALKPLVKDLPSYVMDTKDFLRQLNAIAVLPPGAIIFTMDVVGLYSHIPHEDGLKACETTLERRTKKEPPTSDICHLAKLVLELNAFRYQDKHYLQVHGTAMGTRMAPSYANLFMACLEEKLLATAPEQLTPAFLQTFYWWRVWYLVPRWRSPLSLFAVCQLHTSRHPIYLHVWFISRLLGCHRPGGELHHCHWSLHKSNRHAPIPLAHQQPSTTCTPQPAV